MNKQSNFNKLATNIDNISKRKSYTNTNLPSPGQTLVWKGLSCNVKQAANWGSSFVKLIETPGIKGDLVRWGPPAVVGTAAGVAENEYLKTHNPTMDPVDRISLATAGGIGAGALASPSGGLKLLRTARDPSTSMMNNTLKEVSKQVGLKVGPTAVVGSGMIIRDFSRVGDNLNKTTKSWDEMIKKIQDRVDPIITGLQQKGKDTSSVKESVESAAREVKDVSGQTIKTLKVVTDPVDWIKEHQKPILIGAGVIGGGLVLKKIYDSLQQHKKDERKRKLEELALSRAGIS